MKATLKIAIVDFGLGNLFSVKHACAQAGMEARITSDRAELFAADGIFLPGVGAFGDAMNALKQLDLIGSLQDLSQKKPFIGICLGQQLLMSSSEEFGMHTGLNIIRGRTRHLGKPYQGERRLKVPQVGWNGIHPPEKYRGKRPWTGTALEGMKEGALMYFVHSFYVIPDETEAILAWTDYGDQRFCSSLLWGKVLSFQFHPEKSGPAGLAIYENIARFIAA